MSPRKFTSDTSDTDTEVSFSSSILHDPDYWFNDGNIVVLAKDYQPSARLTGFRVYMGVLSRHSRVFKDLLSPPKVGEDEEIVDGCRSIRVANSCFDFKHLLRALYDGIGFHMHACKFAECAAFVRLGYEYDITAVYKAGLETLRTFLDQRENWASDARCKQGERGFMGLVDMISAANLFRTIGTSKLRAIALYLCTDYVGTDFLVSGAERVDGFQEQLAKDDLIRCLEGRTSLISRRLNYMNDTTAWATDPQLKCYNEGACSTQLSTQLAAYNDSSLVGPGLVPRISRGDKLCTWCECSLRERERKFLIEIWDDLPKIIGLEAPRSTHTNLPTPKDADTTARGSASADDV